MNERRKTVLLWGLIVILLLFQAFAWERQGEDVVRRLGRIAIITMMVYNIRRTKKSGR